MVAESFAHVRAWVFDLDNTLYHPSAGLFAQMEPRMSAFISQTVGVSETEADALRNLYLDRYGTTLAGLMAEHDVDPDAFLEATHDIDLSHLTADPGLAAAIERLPGRRVVYTNGSEAHAHGVIAARGLSGVFDAIYGIEHADYRPKPEQGAFEAIFALDGLSPDQGAMFEDSPRNLAAPHAMGMRTVLVSDDPDPADHIHHHTSDLSAFLSQLLPLSSAPAGA